MLRNYETPNQRVEKENHYKFRRGTTAIKSEKIRNLIVSEEVTLIGEAGAGDAMDTS